MPQIAFGLAVREENRALLENGRVEAAELTFERADDPLRIGPFLATDDLRYVSVHALKLSVASPDPPPDDYVEALAAFAREHGADAVSDHLGFTRGGRSGEIGHFVPPPFTHDALEAVCRNIERLDGRFGGRPFFLENIAYQFRFDGTMTEAEFLAHVLRTTGCGWLLDVTNVYANAVNFGFDALQFLEAVVPAASRLQVHLAGGHVDPRTGFYVDSHSHAIPEEVWELYRKAADLAEDRLEAVFLEWDQNYPDDSLWLSSLDRARELATMAGAV